MSATEELRNFEKKLETGIKSAFKKAIHEDEEFEIAADYDTHSRISDLVKGIDLEVYGMSVTPSEFTIAFEFCGEFQKINTQSKPQYCKIRLENDGSYSLTLREDDLKKSWFLGITDTNFNLKDVPEDVMLDSIRKFSHTLLIKIISN